MTTAILNRFIARTYYDAEGRYLLDRIADADLKPAGTSVAEREELVAALARDYPKVEVACIRDHVNVLYGEKPDLPFFRVANHWNYKKIEKDFMRMIYSGMETPERYLRDFGTVKRNIYYGYADKSALDYLDTLRATYSAEILERSCRFVMGPNLSHVEKFIGKFKREWPARMMSVNRVSLYAGDEEDWSVRYEDGYVVTTVPGLAGMNFVVSSIVPFMTIDPLNLVVWEACVLKYLKDEVVLSYYMRHAVYRSIVDPHEMVVVDYTKVNSMLVTVRAVDHRRLLVLFEKVIAARNEYARYETDSSLDKRALDEANALVAPVLPHVHYFNYRELKIMTYAYVYGVRNDPKITNRLRTFNLPNIIVQADHKFYRKMKEESMKAMVKFAARIDLLASVVCTYSRRPFMRPVHLVSRNSTRHTFMQCLPPSQEKSTSTNKYSFFKQTIVHGEGALVKYALTADMREFFPVASQKGEDFSFVNVPGALCKADVWKEILLTYATRTAPDVGFVIFLWNEKNNSVSRDLQAMGKLNARLDPERGAPKGMCYYVVGEHNFRYAIVGNDAGERILWAAPGKPFLSESCTNLIRASVSLRRYLVTRELRGAEYPRMLAGVDPSLLVSATVYCPSAGSDSAFFGNAVFFGKNDRGGRAKLHFEQVAAECYVSERVSFCMSNDAAMRSPQRRWYIVADTPDKQHFCEYLRNIGCNDVQFAYLYYKLYNFARMDGILQIIQNSSVDAWRPFYCGTALALYPRDRKPPCSIRYKVEPDFWKFAHQYYFWSSVQMVSADGEDMRKFVDDASRLRLREAERQVVSDLLSREHGMKRDLSFVKKMMMKLKPTLPYLDTSKIAVVMNELMIEERAKESKRRAVASVLYGGDLYAIKKFMKHLKENVLQCSDTTVYVTNDCKVLVDKTSPAAAPETRAFDFDSSEDEDECEEEEDHDLGDMISKKSTYDNRYLVALTSSHSNKIHVYDNSLPLLV